MCSLIIDVQYFVKLQLYISDKHLYEFFVYKICFLHGLEHPSVLYNIIFYCYKKKLKYLKYFIY